MSVGDTEGESATRANFNSSAADELRFQTVNEHVLVPAISRLIVSYCHFTPEQLRLMSRARSKSTYLLSDRDLNEVPFCAFPSRRSRHRNGPLRLYRVYDLEMKAVAKYGSLGFGLE